MKKFIAIMLIVVLCLSITACGSSYSKEVREADLSIPNAEEFDIYEWPTFGAATDLPVPNWSNRGKIYGDGTDELKFKAKVGYTTLDDFNTYINALEDAGFNKNIYTEPNQMWYGENDNDCGVSVEFHSRRHYIKIEYVYNASTYEKYWD